MKSFTLDDVYADPLARTCLHGQADAHRPIVRKALAPGEPILGYWWDRGVSGLLLATDRRLIQVLWFEKREMFSFRMNHRFETWVCPYQAITGITITPGSLFQYPVIVLTRKDADPAAIVLTGLKNDAARARADALRDLITACQTHPIPRSASSEITDVESGDLAEQLQRLYDLYRQGGLDEAEYTHAKERLLRP
jgi:hypothetical protein